MTTAAGAANTPAVLGSTPPTLRTGTCLSLLLLAVLAAGCPPPAQPPPPPVPGPAPTVAEPAAEATPLGRLPDDVKPTRYRLTQQIVPSGETFSGVVDIELSLTKPRRVLWIHGAGLRASEVSYQPAGGKPVAGKYEQVHNGGVVRITLDEVVAPGSGTLHIAYEGDFGKRLNGLYRVTVKGDHYAFTQFEPVWSRHAIPCFNEPAFKVPWDITLVARKEHKVIANTREIARADAGNGMVKVTFATTEPLPSYLIAFAVGPLDIVEAPDIAPNGARSTPLPFRGVTARGRGKEMAFALRHTPALLTTLEDYFGIAYPYDKLDIIAVPDKGGAMENAGAVTFREWLLLVDEKTASIDQRRAFAYVMAHELAHQWFGNLVTMPWWDDIWLNEAFATWMGHLAVEKWRPGQQALVRQLSGVHRAMSADSLLSARQIRQPVNNNDDIHNAFDVITYRKGGGVLGMFESWLGADVFQKGLQGYMRKHAHGSATADDLFAALSKAAGRDVATPFRSFLYQPGLPRVSAKLVCDGRGAHLDLSQSRYLPHGSPGNPNKKWQVPVCARYEMAGRVQKACTLMTDTDATLKLADKGCPDWVMPNAGAAGYYVWQLDDKAYKRLRDNGLGKLTIVERMSLARSVRAGFSANQVTAAQALSMVEPLASDAHPRVANGAMGLLWRFNDWLDGTPEGDKLRRYGRKLYGPTARRLGWKPGKGETPETQLLRREALALMTHVVRDPAMRRQATRLARQYIGAGGDRKLHPEALDANLAGVAMSVLGQEADKDTFELLLAHLAASQDDVVRGRLLGALTSVHDPQLQTRALKLSLDDRLKVTEMTVPLYRLMGDRRSRAGAWRWISDNIDPLLVRLPQRRAGWLPSVATSFCSQAEAKQTQALFGPRVAKLAGGDRELKLALERITLCSKLKAAQLAGAKQFFAKQR